MECTDKDEGPEFRIPSRLASTVSLDRLLVMSNLLG
jgi:hypothetical protein